MINEKLKTITTYLDEILPNASCELNYKKDYELLLAVMFSAQTTDKKVNSATEVLFAKYDSLDKLDEASEEEIERIIHPIGLSQTKAKNAKLIIKDLINKYDYKVPSSFEDLTSLNGVGVKTANVVRAELFKIPAIAVDTHVERVSKRLGLCKKDYSPIEVEKRLEKLFDKEIHIKLHHQLIHFGRYYCLARGPKCDNCALKDICIYFKKKK